MNKVLFREMSGSSLFKGFVLALSCEVILASCAANKNIGRGIEGIYIEQGSFNKRLALSDNRYVLSKPLGQADVSPYRCCDTLSIGNWDYVKGTSFIKLKSDLRPQDPLLPIAVQESNSLSSDSLYFRIKNPIDQDDPHRAFELFNYQLEITSNNPEFDARISNRRFKSPKIIVKRPASLKIEMIELIAIPSMEIPVRSVEVRYIYTEVYSLRNKTANHFLINIPDLTYRLISEMRLSDDFIKVISPTKLEWDGKRYQKQ
ncbi:hypothetical protein [Roseivirga sp.]|uniref:hypothetical protein n=1 Tax=Roseivirga sp. TaxID=1964215 RepID=UPI003B8D58CA